MRRFVALLCTLSLGCIGNEIIPAIPGDDAAIVDAADATAAQADGVADGQLPSDAGADADGASGNGSCLSADDPIDWQALYQKALAEGATIYTVDTHADMQAAVDAAVPGDMVLVKSGDYSGWDIVFSARGTAQKPIVVTSESKAKGLGVGGVTFRGVWNWGHFYQTSWLIVGGFNFDNISETVFYLHKTDTAEDANTDNRFTDNTFQNCGVRRGNATAVIEVFGRNHRNRFDHSLFQGNYTSCVRVRWESDDRNLGPSTETRVDHNHFGLAASVGYDPTVEIYDPIPLSTCCSTFRESDPDPTILFEHNTVEHRKVHSEVSDSVASFGLGGATVRYNTFVSDGRTLRLVGHRGRVYGNVLVGADLYIQGSNHRVVNNVLVSNDEVDTAISLPRWGRMAPTACNLLQDTHDVLIAHNTILGALTHGLRIGDCNGGACRPLHDNILIANNLVSMSAGTLIHYNTKDEAGRTTVCDEATYGWKADSPGDADGGLNTGVTFRGNLYHATGEATVGSAHDLDEAPLVTATCTLDELQSVAQPGRLGSGCGAATDAAQSIAGVDELTVDFEGQARGCDGKADVGADELGCGCP